MMLAHRHQRRRRCLSRAGLVFVFTARHDECVFASFLSTNKQTNAAREREREKDVWIKIINFASK
jgi:hypothetical protein